MKLTVEDAQNMLKKLSEAFADKSIGDMWSMGFLTTMHVTDILDLLNSQKAEIEKLNVELVGMRGACESYKMHYDNAQAEIENKNVEIDILIRKKKTLRDEVSELTAENEKLQTKNKKYKAILEAINDEINPLPFETDFDKAINKAKSEAIKEFAERLKKTMTSTRCDKNGYCHYVTEDCEIDNLLKEMVGEEK